MSKTYAKVAGVLLLALGVFGILGIGIPGFLSLDEPAEIAFHLITGAAAAYVGFNKGTYGNTAVSYAKYFGILYLALGLIGFIMPDILGLFHFDLACNVAHIALGVWGVWVGFSAKEAQMAKA